jgi:hypothetical protein
MHTMRLFTTLVATITTLCSVPMLHLTADQNGFLGRWNLTGTGQNSDHVYWLEITDQGGRLEGRFLNRGGSPLKLASVKVEDTELIAATEGRQNRAGTQVRARLKGDKLVGSVIDGDRTVECVGARPPKWPPANASGAHTFGQAVELFDGTTLNAFDLHHPDRPSGWSVADGAMTNEARANNLVSKQKFLNFRLAAEYKLDRESNSGIYLRGRYELQVLDDAGKPPESHGHMAIYAWVAPLVNASKPAGEWQAMEAVLVGNRVTVLLNGTKVHDNAEIQAITGGALDADETTPGPIMIQGDHGKVWFRKLTVTPITRPAS